NHCHTMPYSSVHVQWDPAPPGAWRRPRRLGENHNVIRSCHRRSWPYVEKGAMESKQRRFSIGYTIVTIIAILVVESYLFASRPETLAYSDFIRLLNAGKVSDLTLSKQAIEGTLAANGLETFLPKEKVAELREAGKGLHRFVTTRVDDPQLVHELEAANVRFTGTAENTWL